MLPLNILKNVKSIIFMINSSKRGSIIWESSREIGPNISFNIFPSTPFYFRNEASFTTIYYWKEVQETSTRYGLDYTVLDLSKRKKYSTKLSNG